MADTKEVALGIASVLGSDHAPDPLPVSFRGQTFAEAGTIILAVLAECRDAEIALDRVQMDPKLHREVMSRATLLDVTALSDDGLGGEARFYRKRVSPGKETP